MENNEQELRNDLTYRIISGINATFNSNFTDPNTNVPYDISFGCDLNAISRKLRKASTPFLQEIAEVSPTTLLAVLNDGMKSETVIRESLMYPSVHKDYDYAIRDIRKALNVSDLTTVDQAQRVGVAAALRVSLMAREMSVKRSSGEHRIPAAGYITSEVAVIIIDKPEREQEIIKFIQDRNVISTEIDPDHLRAYLQGERPLAEGIL